MNISTKDAIRNELRCPAEFVKHLSRVGKLNDLKKAVLAGDRIIADDIMSDIRESYRDFCHDAGLDFGADNRKARIGFFFN